MQSFGEHEFVAGTCTKCSIREKDSEFRYYQFCTDELKEAAFGCEPEKRLKIEQIYSGSSDDVSDNLLRIVRYSLKG
jgi:hypothetical protein